MTNLLNLTLKKRMIFSSSSNVFFQVFINILRLIQVPILIKFLGAEGYGKLLVIIASASYITLFELGLKYFAINRLTKLYYEERFNKFKVFYSQILRFILLVSTILIVILLILILALAIKDIINFHFYIAILLFFINNILITFLYFFSSYYKFEGRLVLNFFIETLLIAIPIIGILVLANLKVNSNYADYIYMALISLISTILIFYFILKKINKKIDVLFYLNRKLKVKYILKILSKSIYYLIFSLNNLVIVHFSTLIIAIFLTNYQVAQFNTMKTITNIVVLSIATVTHPLLSEITRYFNDKKSYYFTKIFNFYFLSSIIVLFTINIILTKFGKDIYYIWIKNDLLFNEKIFYFLIFSTSLSIMNILTSNLILSINKHIAYSKFLTIYNIFYVFLCFILTKKFGLQGVVFSLLIYEMLHMLLLVFIYRNYLSEYKYKIYKILIIFIFLIILLNISLISLIIVLLMLSIFAAIDFFKIKIKTENK